MRGSTLQLAETVCIHVSILSKCSTSQTIHLEIAVEVHVYYDLTCIIDKCLSHPNPNPSRWLCVSRGKTVLTHRYVQVHVSNRISS
jgi:hypothetical protein